MIRCTLSACLIALLIGVGSSADAQGPPPTVVFVDAVKIENLVERQRVTGEIRALHRSLVAAEEPGILIELPVREGGFVKQGEVLGRLKNRRLQLLLAEVEAQARVAAALVEQRKAQREQRSFDLEVIERLVLERATNPKEEADARSAAAEAEASLVWADEQRTVLEAQRDLLQERVDQTTIVAPFDGSVVAVHRQVGEWVAEGAAIVELVSTRQLEAWLAVPQRFFGALIDATHPVELVVVATQERISASSVRVVQMVDSVTRNYALVVPLPAAPPAAGRGSMGHDSGAPGAAAPGLALGMSVAAWVPGGAQADYFTVRKGALLRSDVGSYLYVAQPTQEGAPAVVRPVSVMPLFDVGDRVAVQATGLQAGDLIIVEGNERLFPGMPILPKPADTKTAASPAISPPTDAQPARASAAVEGAGE